MPAQTLVLNFSSVIARTINALKSMYIPTNHHAGYKDGDHDKIVKIHLFLNC